MKGGIHVRSRVAPKFVTGNLEARPRRVVRLTRCIAASKERMKLGNGQAWIRRHARLKTMAEIEDHRPLLLQQRRLSVPVRLFRSDQRGRSYFVSRFQMQQAHALRR